MKDIEFRGQRVDNGELTYGYLFVIWEKHYILWGTTNNVPNMIEVISETVGQYIGRNDIKGNKVYDGDILFKDSYWKLRVVYDKCCFIIADLDEVRYINKCFYKPVSEFNIEDWEVIGNIHDNKELI